MSKDARSRYGQISVAERVYIISSLVSADLCLKTSYARIGIHVRAEINMRLSVDTTLVLSPPAQTSPTFEAKQVLTFVSI
jgi:hypothetical protein